MAVKKVKNTPYTHYQVGDLVRIRTIEEMLKDPTVPTVRSDFGVYQGGVYALNDLMAQLQDRVTTIRYIDVQRQCVRIDEDAGSWLWYPYMIEPYIEHEDKQAWLKIVNPGGRQ